MSTKNSPAKYSEGFKKTIVTLYLFGKTYAEIHREYGVSSSALSNWVRKYAQVQVDDDTVLTAQQVKALQRRNTELEEENREQKTGVSREETALPYYKFFTRPLAEIPAQKLAVLAGGPSPVRAVPFADRDLFLHGEGAAPPP